MTRQYVNLVDLTALSLSLKALLILTLRLINFQMQPLLKLLNLASEHYRFQVYT